jgi:anti-sigma regulatory factor (Ser/Thr protein kinase)
LKRNAICGNKELPKLPHTVENSTIETARRSRRKRMVLLAFLLWTAFVALALSRLLANSNPTVWIIHDEGSPQSVQKAQAMFRADAGLQRIYPWILFGPYLALLAAYFPLERGRLKLSLPLNLGACGIFVVACHMVNARTSLKTTSVMYVANQSATTVATGTHRTNVVQVEMVEGGGGGSISAQIEKALTVTNITNGPRSNFIGIVGQHEFGDSRLTNLLAQLPPAVRPGLRPPPPPGMALLPTLLDLLAYGAIIGLMHSVHFYRRFRERERSALVLESNLANARLSALRAQLHPHFLFNSLNAIVALLRRDPRLAEATLMSLSDLLRLALGQAEKQEVPLREEMNFVNRYLEIQQTRFGDKLRVEHDIAPATLDCLVPTLLLQPLVENAIRHGIEPAEKAGLLRITAHRHNGKLVMTVEDDGVGITKKAVDVSPSTNATLADESTNLPLTRSEIPTTRITSKNGTGIGLTNLRARLETLYGRDQTLELSSHPERGVIVRIEVPWHSETSIEANGSFQPQ